MLRGEGGICFLALLASLVKVGQVVEVVFGWWRSEMRE
jgi:hypothetical protein